MNDYGSMMMPIVCCYGSLITAILVDWVLPKIACFRILSALEIPIQVGSQTNLVWWMTMGHWWCLLFVVTVRWSQPFWLIGFYLKYGVFVILSALEITIQVRSQPNLVWWMTMGHWWCLLFVVTVRWSQPFWLTGFYLKYGVFLYTFRTGDNNSSWISAKLGMRNYYGSMMMHIVCSHGSLITTVVVGWLMELK